MILVLQYFLICFTGVQIYTNPLIVLYRIELRVYI
jgi:hypothetical protein